MLLGEKRIGHNGDRRRQFNTYISEDTISGFKETVARIHGIYAKNQWSSEVDKALRYYISVGGILPSAAHTHKNTDENDISTSQNFKRVKENKVEHVHISNDNRNSSVSAGFEGFKDMSDKSPLMQWVTRNGGFKFEQRHYDLADRLRSDPEYREQWHKETIAKLTAKARRRDNLNWQNKLKKRDEEIRPEIREIKQHLVTVDNIIDLDRIDREKLYNAFVVVTNKTDPRTFEKRLKEYIQHEYFYPINREETSFRSGTKFIEI